MLNDVCLMGRLTRDPELRYTPQNTAVTSFSLAVVRDFDKEKTDFIDVVVFGKTAEFAAKWFHKGLLVAVSGRIQTRDWEDKQGNRRKAVEVIAEEVYFAESRRESGENASRAPHKRQDENAPVDKVDSDFSAMDDDDGGELPF